jgi:hypothetical protein
VAEVLGPHDPLRRRERFDGFVPDGTGSVYGLLALVLPGFSLFRYPAKLLSVAALAVAALAGRGWERLTAGETRAIRRWCQAGLGVTLVLLVVCLAARGPIVATLARRLPADIEFGPVDPSAAIGATLRGLVHGGLVLLLGLVLAKIGPGRPRSAGALAVVVMTLDLGIANAPLIWTVPQGELDRVPQALQLIAEREGQAVGLRQSLDPYRVHRMEMAAPPATGGPLARRRLHAAVAWQRDTLEPLYGLPDGVQFTLFQGFLDNEDYVRFFDSESVADSPGSTSTTYRLSSRGMSLWNARYVILPVSTGGWFGGDARQRLERIHPPDSVARGAATTERWIAAQDWQLLRNPGAYPRAWLAHDVRVRPPVAGMGDPNYWDLMQDLVYQAFPSWRQPGRPLYDLRAVAFVETDHPESLAGAVSRTLPGPDERVEVTRYEPQRVELVAQLERPGLVVLADAYYPGWRLAIDGQSAPIYRTNRMMRGAAVKAGRHTLVYTYEPLSVRIGAGISLAGLVVFAALVPWAIRPRTGSGP